MDRIKQKRSSIIWARILIGSLVIGGLFFRFYNIDKKVYWYDEACTSLRVSGYTWAEEQKTITEGVVDVEDLQKFQLTNSEKGLFSTIRALSKDDPHHPPLYYGLLRLWVGWFGESIWIIRSFSAFASQLSLPCIYMLCRELFESRWAAWIAVAIVTVSPFHVLYAQEAREYSLWTMTILLSSAILLWVLHSKTKYLWGLYSVAVAIGLYTHTLFLLVIIAHGIYVIGINLAQVGLKPFRLPKVLIAYLVATLDGLAAFTPWIYVIVKNLSTARAHLSWLNYKVNPFYLIGMWGFNFSSVFMDAGYAFKSVKQLNLGVLLSYSIQVLISMLAAYSIYFLYSKTTRRTWLFVLSLILIPFLGLALPDLILGGTRSGDGYRYLTPSYLGIQLAVAYLLATKINSASLMRRRFWQAVTSWVIVCGIVSCVIISQAETWWTKPDHGALQSARTINKAHQPLLIIEYTGLILVFSHLLNQNVRLMLVKQHDSLQIPDEFSDVFVFEPSSLLQEKLGRLDGFRIVAIDKQEDLWRLTKMP